MKSSGSFGVVTTKRRVAAEKNCIHNASYVLTKNFKRST
jgi:hypothetical protein